MNKYYGNKMRQVMMMIMAMALFSCSRENQRIEVLQQRIDSLENLLEDSYRPGFGEFMSNIQSHHAKLWFAGQNLNWKLADFEISEIRETVDDIRKYETEREESKTIQLILPALDSVSNAIQREDPELFKNEYILLTNTCNSCHRVTQFEFNVVKIPDQQTFSNQDFKIH
jgi:hypothetical protein